MIYESPLFKLTLSEKKIKRKSNSEDTIDYAAICKNDESPSVCWMFVMEKTSFSQNRSLGINWTMQRSISLLNSSVSIENLTKRFMFSQKYSPLT